MMMLLIILACIIIALANRGCIFELAEIAHEFLWRCKGVGGMTGLYSSSFTGKYFILFYWENLFYFNKDKYINHKL